MLANKQTREINRWLTEFALLCPWPIVFNGTRAQNIGTKTDLIRVALFIEWENAFVS